MGRPTRDLVNERVSVILEMRASGAWSARLSPAALAQEWGVPEPVVREYARKAAVMFRDQVGNLDEVRATAISRLMRVIEMGDDREAIKASEALTKLVGANAPEVDLQTYIVGLTIEERRAFCLKLRAMVDEILDALPPEPTALAPLVLTEGAR